MNLTSALNQSNSGQSQVRLRVVLVFRSKKRGRFSIENLFSSLMPTMGESVEVIPYHVSSKWGSLRDVIALRRLKADVYHVTGDIHHMSLGLPGARTILTVHDMNYLLHGISGYKRWLFRKLWFDLPVAHVRVVTAISDETKRMIELHCRGFKRAPLVIPDCVAARFQRVPRDFNFDRPRILFIGTAPWKNLSRLIRAIDGIPCVLVVVGQISETVRDEIEAHGLDYENAVGLSDEELLGYYANCDLLAFVSMREGFGMPIIEAQAVGRPVVTSDRSPMREVAGAGACLVDPSDVADIRRGVLKVIRDWVYRDDLVEKGIDNVRLYSVESVAARYIDAYRGIAENPDD